MATTKKATKMIEAAPDAIALLKDDHKKVKALFEEYKKLCDKEAPDSEKAAVAGEICKELTIHAQVEEEIFYPALREAGLEEDVMDEAEVEHAGAKDLIAQLETMSPDEPLYDAKVHVLGENIDHHVKEEEGEMFPKAKKTGVDMAELGSQMDARKDELKDAYEADASGPADPDDELEAAMPPKKSPANGKASPRTR